MTQQLTKNNIYKKLANTIKPYIWALILTIIGLIGTKLIEAGMYKYLLPKLVNLTKEVSLSNNILLAVIGASFLWGIFRFISKYFIGYMTKSVSKDLRSKILIHILLVPISFFSKNAIGNLISKVNYDVEQIARAISDSVLELLSSIIAIMFFVGVMFSFSWQLTLIALTMAPLIAMFLKFINIKIIKYSDRVQQSIGNISHLAHEIIEASQVIRIFEAVATETNRIRQLMHYNFKQELKIVIVSALSEATMRIIIGNVLVILIYIVTSKHLNVSAGNFIGLCGAMIALIRPVKQLSEVNSVIAKGLAAAYSVFELLELPTEPNNPAKITNLTSSKFNNAKTISLYNVNFKYIDQPVLENINLTFEPGKITALVGRSGSGKSTLVALLPRFYQINYGSICLNDININDLDLIKLRKQFAIINQNIVLLNDTVANNIAYGSMNTSSREQIIRAAISANAMEFIEQLPNGLDTYIGNNGNLLSGGQRQRIAIARALLKNAPILILDEATSALDPHSDRLIQAALTKLKHNNITIISIAHRMSTIENADQIVILDAGKIVAIGSHQELSKNLYYTSLYKVAVNETL